MTIALLVLHQQQQAVRLITLHRIFDPDIATQQRFQAFTTGSLIEFDRPKQVGKVGERNGRHRIVFGGFDIVVNAHCAVHNGVLTVTAQMNKCWLNDGNFRRFHGFILTANLLFCTYNACK